LGLQLGLKVFVTDDNTLFRVGEARDDNTNEERLGVVELPLVFLYLLGVFWTSISSIFSFYDVAISKSETFFFFLPEVYSRCLRLDKGRGSQSV
jgi:hypothetical protein